MSGEMNLVGRVVELNCRLFSLPFSLRLRSTTSSWMRENTPLMNGKVRNNESKKQEQEISSECVSRKFSLFYLYCVT